MPLSFAVSSAALAFEPFVVRDIRVEGLQRTEPGSVFGYLPVRIGDRLTEARSSEAVKALYATGFYKDVRLSADDGVLVVHVVERPAIAAVDISGAKEFDVETLKKALRENGLAEARIYDRAVLDRAERELRKQYLSRSKYSVRITSTVTPLERNRVGVAIHVDEGGNARIRQVRILGNKAFRESTLLDQINLTTPTWISWYTKTDQYSREKLAGDLERLRSFYLNRGYLEFGIESTQVSIDPERRGVYVTLTIHEGEKYTVRDVNFGGELLGREQEFRRLLRVHPGQTYSGEKMTESVRNMTEALGAIGYAFATITPVPDIDREGRRVGFTLNVDPGRRAYVRRINISGNQRTRDEVIRRELRQFEGAWFDADRIRISRDRIERLGYFQNVTIANEPVPGTPDQVDLRVQLTERQTGNFTFGVGFSSTDKFLVTASISEPNFLGTGNNVSLEVNTGRLQRSAALSIVQPYFTADGISRSIDVYSRLFNAAVLGLGDYRLRTTGLGLRFGIPYTEMDRVSVGLGYERNDIKIGASGLLPRRYIQHIAEFGENSGAILAYLGWSRDSRDSALTPTRGLLHSANLEVTTPGQKLRYVRGTYNFQNYTPLTKDYTLAFNGALGFGSGLGNRAYPVFKNFYAGGIGSVRGFYPSSLGPHDTVDNLPIGGRYMMGAGVEFLGPLPGAGNDRSVRWFLFGDTGNVWDSRPDLSELRYAVGAGINWLSPIGPLKLSFGFPVRKKVGDRTQRFQFQIGTGF